MSKIKREQNDGVNNRRNALGRGLAALIPGAHTPMAVPAGAAVVGGRAPPDAGGSGDFLVAIEDIHPSAQQPRKNFDDTRLNELADSIRAQGIIQPLILRERKGGGYELVAGERRWRAAQRAGLHQVPAVVKRVAEKNAFEMALVENLQRQDLNPIEEADGYQRLVSEFGYTQESLAARVGKERSTVANALRLLRLPKSVRELVVAEKLSMGHARALLGLESATAIERLAQRTVTRGLSVRQVERAVQAERSPDAGKRQAAIAPTAAARDLVSRLQRHLGARVNLVQKKPGQGHIEIHFQSLDELDAVLDKILR